MRIDLKPGTYVVAVSGGVDSMVLLHLLTRLQSPVISHQSPAGPEENDWRLATGDWRLVVAHFEHGIRPDSEKDFLFVRDAAKKYGLPFVAAHGKLGPGASEAVARKARYNFLAHVMAEEKADAIVTAHHQDDVLETAILNMLRGTGRLGLSSLRSKGTILRPLLAYTKQNILEYAHAHAIVWREDSTNADDRYLRNYIRHNIVTRLGERGRALLVERIEHARAINDQIDELLQKDIELQPALNELSRKWFIRLPYAVAAEVMAMWLRRHGIAQFDRALIDRLVVHAKTKRPGKTTDVNATYSVTYTRDGILLKNKV